MQREKKLGKSKKIKALHSLELSSAARGAIFARQTKSFTEYVHMFPCYKETEIRGWERGCYWTILSAIENVMVLHMEFISTYGKPRQPGQHLVWRKLFWRNISGKVRYLKTDVSEDKEVVSRSKPVRNTWVAGSRTLQVMSTSKGREVALSAYSIQASPSPLPQAL